MNDYFVFFSTRSSESSVSKRQASGGFPIVGVFDRRGKARDCERAL